MKLEKGVSDGEIEALGLAKRRTYRLKVAPQNPILVRDDVGDVSIEPAFLLVYAAAGNGQIIKIQTLGSLVQVSADGKQFMVNALQRESTRWTEALDKLISWGWVKAAGYKGKIYELTGTGYKKADWLKDGMKIDTSRESLEELKEFE